MSKGVQVFSAVSSPTSPQIAKVDGWPINLPTLKEAVSTIRAAALAGESFSVFTLNLDHLVKLRRHDGFRKAYRSARFITADGAPVAYLARMQSPAVERATGADLLVPLAQEAARNSIPVFLFGSTADVLAKAGRDLSFATAGDLDITGTLAPSHDFDPEGREADAAIERIRNSGTKLCFVALGAPKQEIFAARAVAKGVPCGFVCIGAALDFVAGAQIRAPKVMQNNGLEWLWRLSTSPRRLGLRYAQCALLLFDVAFVGPLRQRFGGYRT